MYIDASEFESNVKILSNILEKKLENKIRVRGSTLQINDKLSKTKVKDALKRSLHELEPIGYRVVSKPCSIKIKKLKSRSIRIKKKEGAAPSASHTLPYFFPR